MRLSGSGVYLRPAPAPRMPPGLVELMQGLTRAVLQRGPCDLPRYCADHLEQLLVIRDGRAPTKQRLTLEQKIKIAQEKVREKAEIRRRKYDEEMKMCNLDMMSAEKIKQDVTSTSREENPIAEKVNTSAEPITETNLKAPVHHEQDIAESLEVEIFHKPVENMCNSMPTEAKIFDECTKIDTGQDEINSEEIVLSDTSKEKNDLVSKEKQEGNLADAHANGLLEVNESISKDSEDHPKIRRGVLEKNDETNEKIQNEAAEIQKNVDNTNELKVELQDKNPEEAEVSSPIMSENNMSEINQDQSTSNNETYTNNITKEGDFDLGIVSANEFTKTLQVPEFDISNDDKQALNNAESRKDDKEQVLKINEMNTDIDSKNTIDYERTAQVEALTKSSEIEVHAIVENSPKNIVATLEQTAVELNNGNNEILSEIDQLTEIATIQTLTTDKKSNAENNQDEMHARSVTENNELSTDAFIIIKEADESSISNKNDTKTIRYSERREEEEILSNNDEEIINAMDQLEVCSDNIHKEDNLDVNEKLPPESDGNELTAEVFNNKSFADVHVVDNDDSIANESSDDGILVVNKVLIELPGVRDKNDSAQEQIVENSDTDSNLHINGAHGNTNNELMKNGNESPTELEIVRIEEIKREGHDILKDSEIAEIQDDVTTISEPIKTDLDTSSLGKSSSMDDSFIDEAVDSIMGTERDSNDEKATIKLAQNKENSSGMDLETAAVTIQKVFRTFLFKSRESTFDDTGRGNSIDGDNEKSIVDFPVVAAPINKERRTLGISRMDTVLQTVNEEKSLSLSTDDSSLSSAATIIQAHVRGFLTRNRLNSKTNSLSLVNSDGPSSTSFENDPEQKTNKTVLNIHIVPEGEHFLSRDESLLTSMELSLDGSPPSSTNLHPLGYDKNEPRKQLKREDAIQSISPPSNNSGKLSEDIDSVKDMPITDSEQQKATEDPTDEIHHDANFDRDDTPTKSTTIETVIETHKLTKDDSSIPEPGEGDVEKALRHKRSLLKASSDECDVVTPYEEKSSTDSDATSRLLHSGEFHDIVLPTKVSRGDTSVVREFKNVLVYFLMWNNS